MCVFNGVVSRVFAFMATSFFIVLQFAQTVRGFGCYVVFLMSYLNLIITTIIRKYKGVLMNF